MAFRGYFALNGVELANSSRVVAHLGSGMPTSDVGVWTDPVGDCNLVPAHGGNDLPNPEFETDLSGWTNLIGNWVWDTGAAQTVGNGTDQYLLSPITPWSVEDDQQDEATFTATGLTGTNLLVALIGVGYAADGTTILETAYIDGPPWTTLGDTPGEVTFSGSYSPVTPGVVKTAIALAVMSGCTGGTVRFLRASRRNIDPLAFEVAPSMVQVSPGMYTPPDGSRRFGPGLIEVGDACWGPSQLCSDGCRSMLDYDDSWPGLRTFLGHTVYRPELAPWYVSEQPESAEFGGVWVMSCDGLDVTPVSRDVQPVVGPGGVAGPSRDPHRTVRFEALLIACTHAGLNYGLQWLACNLRDATVDDTASLSYLAAHPSHSGVDPASLVREAAGVVLTAEPKIMQEYAPGPRQNQQATIYRVSWEFAILSPYAYVPAVTVPVDWHDIVRQPINWIHSADCGLPENCIDMPVMFSTECVPEEISVVNTPPPVCGGCLPVSEISKYLFRVPTMDYPFRCRSTAVTQTIRNVGEHSLSLQAFWRLCGTDIRCEDNRFPLQIAGLPPGAELVLDGITGRYKAFYDGYWRKVRGVVGTPNGAPWRPPLIDRQECWEFVVQSATTADFEVELSLRDREA